MKLEQSFEVAAPLERVWEALIDVQRVAPCLPGASVAGRNEDGSYNGEFKVKIGPTSAAYSGKLNMEDVDADAHRATMQASGTDRRGQGGAKATIVSSVAEAGEGTTRVEVSTDYHITGRLARFGRGGMIEEISNRLLGDFATNLQAMLVGGAEAPATEQAPPAAEEVPADQAPAAEDAPADQAPAPEDAPPAEAPPTETLAEEAIASEEVPAQPTDETSAEDPDAAIEGATPVASATEAEPAEPSPPTEPSSAESVAETPPAAAAAPPPPPPAGPATAPAPPPPAGAAPPPPPPPPPSSAPESEPVSALSLVGSVALKRAKENPVPLAALVIGFLTALRLLRRRS